MKSDLVPVIKLSPLWQEEDDLDGSARGSDLLCLWSVVLQPTFNEIILK